MAALLSHSSLVGLAKESVLGTYVPPTTYVPLLGSSSFEDMITLINDESYRNNDSMLQGAYQGAAHGEWQIDVMAYPDVIGPFLRAIIGPDTVTAATSTTLTSSTSIGATSITTGSALTTGQYIKIDTGTLAEYALVTTGGTTSTVTSVAGSAVGLTKAHASSVAVVSQTTHTFAQNISSKPTYSITFYDNIGTYGGVGASLTDLTIKIDPKAAVVFNTKWMSYLSAAQSAVTATYTTLPPLLGYQWTMTNGGGASTRGLSLDWNIKRAADPIASSDGTLSPREIFVGPIDVSGTYKAIFDSNTDMNLYLSNNQTSPTTALVQQRVQDGGASLAITTSQGAWTKGKRDFNPIYMQANFTLNGIYNTTDLGSVSAVLKNFVTTGY